MCRQKNKPDRRVPRSMASAVRPKKSAFYPILIVSEKNRCTMNRDGCNGCIGTTSQGQLYSAHGKRGHALLWLSKDIRDQRKWSPKVSLDRTPGRSLPEHGSARFGIPCHRSAHSPDQRLMRGILHPARPRSTRRPARPFLSGIDKREITER